MNTRREQLRKEIMIIESLFMVADKYGNDIPFILNPVQKKLLSNLTGRDLVPKARQEGVSTAVLALFTVRCMYKRNTRAVVISHDKESTMRLFKRVQYFIDTLRGPRPVTGVESKTELGFPKTNSTFYIGTAGAKKFGRGDTITDLHCSEIAFWDNPKELFSGLSDSVPVDSGTIILESTGNGRNWYCNRVMQALQGNGRYAVHFFNWQDFPEYNLPISEEDAQIIIQTLDPAFEEDVLYNEGLLTPGQLLFRRQKLEEKDWDIQLFKQEYPMSVDECFQSTSTGLFNDVVVTAHENWKILEQDIIGRAYGLGQHPRPGHHYALGADVGGGVGLDYSVIEVVCIETMQQVYEYASNKIAPDKFGEKVIEVGKKFGFAYLSVERNNHGLVTLKVINDSDYPSMHILKDKKVNKMNPLMSLGFYTTSKSKPLAVGILRRFFREGLRIYSPLLRDELSTFAEQEGGQLEASEGHHDDRVMAMVICMAGYNKAAMLVEALSDDEESDGGEDPFSLESIIAELQGRDNKFPIAPQVGVIQ